MGEELAVKPSDPPGNVRVFAADTAPSSDAPCFRLRTLTQSSPALPNSNSSSCHNFGTTASWYGAQVVEWPADTRSHCYVHGVRAAALIRDLECPREVVSESTGAWAEEAYAVICGVPVDGRCRATLAWVARPAGRYL